MLRRRRLPGADGAVDAVRTATSLFSVVRRSGRRLRARWGVVERSWTSDTEIRDGFASGQFVLHYQPIVRLADGALTGFEALVRWEHPTRGLLPPARFLEVVEEVGAIDLLGRHVLDEACAQLRAWSTEQVGEAPLTLSVNVSTSQLHEPLITNVSEALERHGLEPGMLVLEITEGALHGDLEEAIAVLWELRGLGVRLAIDDFGTGHSSLARLRNLPFDILKVDRSFVTTLADDRACQSVLVAIVAVAEAFGLRTVAEGVEGEDELRLARSLGCDDAQGYLLGRPAPAEEFAVLVTNGRVPGSLFGDTSQLDDGEAAAARAAFDTFAAGGGDGASLDLHLRPLLHHLRSATGLEALYLTHIDWDRQQQHVVVSETTGPLTIEEGMTLAWWDTPCRIALRNGSDSYRDLQATLGSPAARSLGMRTHISTPVTIDDAHIYGTLCAASSTEQPLQPSITALFRIVARLIASYHVTGPARPMPARRPVARTRSR